MLALVLVTTSAAAQSAASGSASTTTSSAQHDTSHKQRSRADVVEQRISDMHAQLKINDQQSQQWDKFAQTMRDNAQTADRAFRARMQTFSSLNADESMKSYAALAQLHADNMQKLSTAFSTLYASLSDEQKKTADAMFRNEHRKEHAPLRKHKPAAPSGNASAAAP